MSSNSSRLLEFPDMPENRRENPRMPTTLLLRMLESLPDMPRTSPERPSRPPPSRLLMTSTTRSFLLPTLLPPLLLPQPAQLQRPVLPRQQPPRLPLKQRSEEKEKIRLG